jgi:hypothetical protein
MQKSRQLGDFFYDLLAFGRWLAGFADKTEV